MENPKLVEYEKYMYSKNKMLLKPIKIIHVGFDVYSDKNKIVIAESIHIGKHKQFAKLKVIPKAKDVTNLEITKEFPKIKKLHIVDTLLIKAPMSAEKVLKLKNKGIYKIGFHIDENQKYSVLATSYAYEKNKFTDIIAIPKESIKTSEFINLKEI